MKVMITGHRPNKLGGYSMDSALVKLIECELRKVVSKLDPDNDVAICGMAQGVDQLFAEICLEFGVPVHAYLPFIGQELRWPESKQKKYHRMLLECEDIKIVSPHPTIAAYKVRNAVMAKTCDRGIAVWDGSRGGTANAVELLKIAGKQVTMISTDGGAPSTPVS